MTDLLWETDTPIRELSDEITVPDWIEPDISPCDVAAINQGGCASGAYMPAVTYHQAQTTMAEHGDDVLQFIEDRLGELPDVPDNISWSGLACHYLSAGVELWAAGIEDELTDILAELETAD